MSTFSVNLRNTAGTVSQKILPRRTKRLILYASLTAQLRQQSELDTQTLVKLNDVMRLSGEVDAMKLPAYLREAIWRGREQIDIPDSFFSRHPDPKDMDNTVKTLSQAIPQWLRYDRDPEIVKELRKYFTHVSELLDRRLSYQPL